jgi:predicted nucleic acid-binding protein
MQTHRSMPIDTRAYMRTLSSRYTHIGALLKLSIYVPDERADDIERWRESLNFSKLFVEAFDRAVAREVVAGKLSEKDTKMVIERLRKEAGGTFEYAWKEGAKLGRVWAIRHAHLSDLRNVAEGVFTYAGRTADVRLLLWGDYVHCGYAKTPEDEYEDVRMAQEGTDVELYRRGHNQGFVEAVKEIWEEIKGEFDFGFASPE